MIIWKKNTNGNKIINNNTRNMFKRLTKSNEHDNKHTKYDSINDNEKVQTN